MTGGVPSAGTDSRLRVDRDGAVLTVTLDRPEQLNAQTPETWSALAAIGRDLDPDVRVVVVRGTGRAFSAGLDRSLFDPAPDVRGGLGELGRLPAEEAQERIRGYQGGFRWLRSPGIVSVAAVQGHAIGAGAQLALACDLRVLTEDADLRLPEATLGLVPDLTGTSTLTELVGYSRAMEICLTGRPVPAAEALALACDLRVLADDAQVRLPEATLGLVPDLTGTSTLVEAVGYSRALEICLTGRAVGAAEAQAIGLATLVVPAAELDGAVADLVAAVLAPSVDASRATAALVRSAVRNDPDAQDAAERAAQVRRLHALVGGR